MSDKKEIHFVTGRAYYACVHQPNKATDKLSYTMDLSVDKDNASILTKLGLEPALKKVDKFTKAPKQHEEGKDVFAFKCNSTYVDKVTGDVKATAPPKVYGESKKLTKKLVGNGSLVEVGFTIYEYNFKGKTGVSNNLKAVKILELVPVEPHKPIFDDVEDVLEEEEVVEKESFSSADEECPFE